MQDSTDMLNSANSWYTLGNVDDDEQERTCVPAHRVLRLQVGRVAIHAKKWKQPSYLRTTTLNLIRTFFIISVEVVPVSCEEKDSQLQSILRDFLRLIV